MKPFFSSSMARAGTTIALAMAAFVGGGAAHAAGTLANTDITNLATLTYSVGSISQPAIGSSETGNTSGAGTATTFKVDNKVNLTVVTTDVANVFVVPGTTTATAVFTVTNTGNSTQDFSFTPSFNYADLTPSPFGGTTDSFNPTSCTATAGGAAYIDELAPDANATVTVLCTIPTGLANGKVAVISLTAQALAGGTASTQGAALTQTTAGAELPGVVDIVFADVAGPDDALRDAKHSARDAFQVRTALLTVTKTVATVCDPVKGSTNPVNIPGAFVRYTITIANTGNVSASLSSVTDTLNTSLTFDSDFIAGSSAATCVAGNSPSNAVGNGFKLVQVERGFTGGTPKWLTTSANSDGATAAAGVITIDFPNALPAGGAYAAGELKAAESVQVIYQVKIN